MSFALLVTACCEQKRSSHVAHARGHVSAAQAAVQLLLTFTANFKPCPVLGHRRFISAAKMPRLVFAYVSEVCMLSSGCPLPVSIRHVEQTSCQSAGEKPKPAALEAVE